MDYISENICRWHLNNRDRWDEHSLFAKILLKFLFLRKVNFVFFIKYRIQNFGENLKKTNIFVLTSSQSTHGNNGGGSQKIFNVSFFTSLSLVWGEDYVAVSV